MPKITIIVPVYNAEKTLERCVDSIRQQTFSDIEVLLIDDGSKDTSPAICDRYANLDQRIRVIHKENAGVSAARNTGIENAHGKYVMFCDSDDSVSRYWCQVMYENIEQDNTAYVMHNILNLPADAAIPDDSFFEGSPQIINSYYQTWQKGNTGYCFNKIFRTDVLNSFNIRFNKNIHIAEDAIFNTEYYKHVSKTIYLDNKLYFHFDYPGSLIKRYYYDFFPIYSASFTTRLPLIACEELGDFCDAYLPTFISYLNLTFERNDPKGFFAKLRFNQKIVKNDTFQFCVRNAAGKHENPHVIAALKKSYYLYFLLMKATSFKK